MNTSLSRMTTEQLIEACANQGIVVSVTQLARWVKEGLIPTFLRRRHGRGRGMGAEWHWEAECLPRAVLIARALAARDPSFQYAARCLAEAGYAPEEPYLRMVLIDCLTVYKQSMIKRQTYLTNNYPQPEKRKRLTKHVRRKMPDLPDSVFEPLISYIGALLGVISPDDPNVPDWVKQLQQSFSHSALHQRLETIDARVLLEKYEAAGHMIPVMVPVLVRWVNWFILPLLKQQLQKEGHETSTLRMNIDLEAILESIQPEAEHTLISNSAVGKLRLYFTIFLTAFPVEDVALLTQLSMILPDILSQFLKYRGIPSESIDSLMENADAP